MSTTRTATGWASWVCAASMWAMAPACPGAPAEPPVRMGPVPQGSGPGGLVVSTQQLVRPAGSTLAIDGRPVDLAATPDGRMLIAKDNRGLVAIDAASWTVKQELPFPSKKGASMTGLIVSPDGRRVWASDAGSDVVEFGVADDGVLSVIRTIPCPGPGGSGASYPCGLALSHDGAKLLVCLSRNNSLGIVNLASGKVESEIPAGVAPWGVVIGAGKGGGGDEAYVSCWGGRMPKAGESTATSAGTPALVDQRGVAASGGLAIINLVERKMSGFVETGLSASAVAASTDGGRIYVANANADTVSAVDPLERRVVEQIVVKPDLGLPFGSMPHGLALSKDGKSLFVACAGNNAVAVIALGEGRGGESGASRIRGWIPTGWYPGGVVALEAVGGAGGDSPGGVLAIANIKGEGSRRARKEDGAFNTHMHRGTLQKTAIPDDKTLAEWTERVLADGRTPQALRAMERADAAANTAPAPVPAQAGAPSPIRHIFYVIKENRTYDQVFGDFGAGPNPKGDSDPKLCIYGRDVTPNQHALAEQFVLLDNFYCNGVLSADGHSWATEGNVTPYLERSFGGFTRSYTFGDDPLTYSSSGFLWDHVLGAGLSFRNYGEFDTTDEKPDVSWPEIWADWKAKGKRIRFEHAIGVERVKRYSNLQYPGWNMDISEQIRADVFIDEFKKLDDDGTVPNLCVIYLPQDHTMGVTEGGPTPRACVADNDLGLGRIIEAISAGRVWESSAIFVVEDDPQGGWDHVDGHRSTCLVVSPYARRGEVVSEFYSQASVVHTMERILGLPAPNQLSAAAQVMSACFLGPGSKPDLRGFKALQPAVAIDELTPPKKGAMAPCAAELYEISAGFNLRAPDGVEEDGFNRVLWHAAKGCEDYPAEWAGAHGRGLAARGLRLDPAGVDDDDDDDGDEAPGQAAPARR